MAGVSRNSSEGGDDSAIGDEEVEEDDDEALEPLPPVQLPSTTAKYALCVDVLGNTSCLGQSELGCFQAFAEELAKALLRTQRDAVERQAKEMLNGAAREALEEELVRLQQKSAERLESLEQQQQAEALRLLEEEEAEEERHRDELQRDREQQLQNAFSPGGGADSQPSGDEDSGGEDQREDEEEASLALSRELVLDAASARAGLQAFNEEVLSPLKQEFSFSERLLLLFDSMVQPQLAMRPVKLPPGRLFQ